MATSTRFRAPSLSIRLARWVLTVLRLMWSSSAISVLVRPRATVHEDLLLAGGERFDRLRRRLTGPCVGERGEQPDGDAGCDQRVAVGGGVDGLGEQLGSGVLEQEPAGAGLERAVDVLVEVEGGDDHDGQGVGRRRGRRVRGWPRCRPVRASGCRTGTTSGRSSRARRDCLAPVGGLRRPPRCRAGRRGSSQPGAHDVLVVGDEHPDAHRRGPGSGQDRVDRPAPLGPGAGRRRCRRAGWRARSCRPGRSPARRRPPAPARRRRRRSAVRSRARPSTLHVDPGRVAGVPTALVIDSWARR